MTDPDRNSSKHEWDGTAGGDLESTVTLLNARARAMSKAMEELFHRHLAPSNAGREVGCRIGRAICQIRMTLSRTRCCERLSSWSISIRAVSGHSMPTFDKRWSTACATSCVEKGGNRTSQILPTLTSAAIGHRSRRRLGRETLEHYQAALERLRPEEREAIVARVEMGYSYEELAQVLGKPTPDAARKAAQRALVRLAEEMRVIRE